MKKTNKDDIKTHLYTNMLYAHYFLNAFKAAKKVP